MEREPVVLANMIAAAVSAVLVALVALGYLPWSEGQQAAVVGAVIAITNMVVAIWARERVTPISDPRAKNAQGQMVSLAPADGSELPNRG